MVCFYFSKNSGLIICLGLRETDLSSQGESSILGGVVPSPDISEDDHSRSGTPLGREYGINSNLDNIDGDLQRTEELSSKSPPSLRKNRRKRSSKPPKIRVLDAFGREQDPVESHVEDTDDTATPRHSTVSRGELLSRIRNGLDGLVVGIDDLDK